MSHRLHRLILILVLALSCLYGINHRGTQTTETFIVDLSKKAYQPYQQEYERMLYPTVRIKTLSGTGSGVIFQHGDTETRRNWTYILSAAHVVDNYSEVQVEIYRSLTDTLCLRASVVLTDTVKDLALLVSRIPNPVSRARLAPKDYKPYIFTPVWAVGCSLGLPPRPSFGYITAIPQSAIDNPHWEISSPILPGNSGGPVYDARTYEVIGIAVWVRTYQGQLVTTMAGVVPIGQIYEFLATDYSEASD
ncbi:MAG: trypsin-like peptidase domain-containing protein [Planctomycetes bacterium]|nr:trypsin-like peptidase domain-containing protein [Planctomycetota bacterium]